MASTAITHPLLSLPTEILELILDYAADLLTLMRVSTTCHDLRWLLLSGNAKHLWEQQCLVNEAWIYQDKSRTTNHINAVFPFVVKFRPQFPRPGGSVREYTNYRPMIGKVEVTSFSWKDPSSIKTTIKNDVRPVTEQATYKDVMAPFYHDKWRYPWSPYRSFQLNLFGSMLTYAQLYDSASKESLRVAKKLVHQTEALAWAELYRSSIEQQSEILLDCLLVLESVFLEDSDAESDGDSSSNAPSVPAGPSSLSQHQLNECPLTTSRDDHDHKVKIVEVLRERIERFLSHSGDADFYSDADAVVLDFTCLDECAASIHQLEEEAARTTTSGETNGHDNRVLPAAAVSRLKALHIARVWAHLNAAYHGGSLNKGSESLDRFPFEKLSCFASKCNNNAGHLSSFSTEKKDNIIKFPSSLAARIRLPAQVASMDDLKPLKTAWRMEALDRDSYCEMDCAFAVTPYHNVIDAELDRFSRYGSKDVLFENCPAEVQGSTASIWTRKALKLSGYGGVLTLNARRHSAPLSASATRNLKQFKNTSAARLASKPGAHLSKSAAQL